MIDVGIKAQRVARTTFNLNFIYAVLLEFAFRVVDVESNLNLLLEIKVVGDNYIQLEFGVLACCIGLK